MKNKNIIRALIIPALILLIPFISSLITSEMNWDETDYILAYLLMAGSGLFYLFLTKSESKKEFRIGVAISIVTAFLLIWGNLAVGLIGNEEHHANLFYFGVIAIGVIGTIVSRVKPVGMYITMYTVAIAQFLVPIVAIIIWKTQIDSGFVKVLIFNFFFVLMWSAAAFFFKRSIEIEK